MTENEAIRDLEYLIEEYSAYPPETGVNETIGSLQYCITALKEIQQYRKIGSVGEIKQAIGVLSLSENDIIKTFHELNEYRKIGTVEQVKNQKENLNVAYQIISDYEQYGTIEDFKKAQRYMRLVNAHGTIGRVIDSCAEYESIGTVEECREAVEKQKPKKPIPINYQDYADKIDNAEFFEGSYFCPNCGTVLRSGSYCNRCGQKLGWNENLEGMEYE